MCAPRTNNSHRNRPIYVSVLFFFILFFLSCGFVGCVTTDNMHDILVFEKIFIFDRCKDRVTKTHETHEMVKCNFFLSLPVRVSKVKIFSITSIQNIYQRSAVGHRQPANTTSYLQIAHTHTLIQSTKLNLHCCRVLTIWLKCVLPHTFHSRLFLGFLKLATEDVCICRYIYVLRVYFDANHITLFTFD